MNNNNKDSIMFDVFRNQKILKSLGSYVDNLEEIKKIESNKLNRDFCILLITIFGSIVAGFILNQLGYNITAVCVCICLVVSLIIMSRKYKAEKHTIDTIINAFKSYIILELLHQQDTINFKNPLDEVAFSVFNDVLDEIHVFDSSICITDHIGYTAEKQIKSVTFKNVDSEKLRKIINLNALEHFDYAPIL